MPTYRVLAYVKKDSTLELEPQGDDFLLKRVDARGNQASMLLSQADVLKLALSAQRMRDTVEAARNPVAPGITVATVTLVAQVRLNTDLHQTVIAKDMIDGRNAEMKFALPLLVAKAVAATLPRWVAKLEAAAAVKKVQ